MRYLLLILVSALFFSLTYASAPDEFTAIDLGILVCLLAGVMWIESLIIHMFSRYRILQNLILAGFTTINILFINLVLNQGFINLPKYAQLLCLLLVLYILTTLMTMVDENIAIAKILSTCIAVATTGILIQTLFSSEATPKLRIKQGNTTAENIRIVDFKSKPNVYFISFDSLIPKLLLQKHLGLETTPYHEVLDIHFRRFKNFFADYDSTRPSLNSLLALDSKHFSEAGKNKYKFFSGLIPSPLLEIFKANGYITNTLYRSQYLGPTKGPHVDNYHYRVAGWDLKNGVCEFIDTWGYRALTFMGYCTLVNSEMFYSVLERLGFSEVGEADKEINFLIDQIRSGLQKDIPQVFVAYIFSPGHSPHSFDMTDSQDFNNYKLSYLNESANTAIQINKLVSFIAREDPEALIYLFGDHGPHISRGMTFEEGGKFFVQDRFGIYGGIYPNDRCPESFSKPDKNFITLSQGALMLLRCLSGGENAFITLEDYTLPEFETTENHRYEDYLYE